MGDEMKRVARQDFYDKMSVTNRDFLIRRGETDASRFWKRVLAEHGKKEAK